MAFLLSAPLMSMSWRITSNSEMLPARSRSQRAIAMSPQAARLSELKDKGNSKNTRATKR
jgi:hypothetical protein